MTVKDAPTNELGYAAGIGPAVVTAGGRPSTGFELDGLELTPELTFPASTAVYDRMRRSDGQLAGTMRAITMPIRSTGWRLLSEGVRPEVLRACEAEFAIGDNTGRQRRRRQGIVFAEHLRDVLLMLPFGFMPFESVYEVGPAAPGLEDTVAPGSGGLVAHVRKLAPRMPRTLRRVEVAPDGGLEAIWQNAPLFAAKPGDALLGIRIPTERLVMYVNEREGTDWTGTSVLRAAYKHWLIADALYRLGPMIVERNGMGVPVVTYPAGGDKALALAAARGFRAGSDAGVALPNGYTLSIVGAAGKGARDELPLIEHHQQAASKSLLTMFMDLGHDNGARALGDTFVDYFLMAEGAVIDNVEETFTEHVIRDFVELNYGPDEAYPRLKADELSANATPTAIALKALADAGLLTPDDDLEAELRRRNGLPKMGTPRPAPAAPAMPTPMPGDVVDPTADPTEEEPPSVGNVTDLPTPPGRVPAPVIGSRQVHVPAHTRTVPTRRAPVAASDDLAERALNVAERLLALREGHPTP